MKIKRILSFGAFIIIFIGIFLLFNHSQTWSYHFQGASEHWEGECILTPTRDKSMVVFVGKLMPKTSSNITQFTVQTDLVIGRPKGTWESPNFEEGKPLQIFGASAGNGSIPFRAGLSTEEINSIFYRDLVFEITWNDDSGMHAETIFLKFVPRS